MKGGPRLGRLPAGVRRPEPRVQSRAYWRDLGEVWLDDDEEQAMKQMPLDAEMPAEELDEILGLIRMSGQALGELTGYSRSGVRRWLDGTAQTPPHIRVWLRKYEAFWLANPPPSREEALLELVQEAA
jgi:hypothetical protein